MVDLFNVADLMSSLPFERNGEEFLSRAKGIKWKIERDDTTQRINVLPSRKDSKLEPFSFPMPPDFPALGQAEPCVGTWYLISCGFGDQYAVAWLVCSQIENENKYIFALIPARKICQVVTARNIYELENMFAIRPLEGCIQITDAVPYSDPCLLEAKQKIQTCSQEHLEQFHPRRFPEIMQKYREKERERAIQETLMSSSLTARKTGLFAGIEEEEGPPLGSFASMGIGDRNESPPGRRFVKAVRPTSKPQRQLEPNDRTDSFL